MVGLMSEAMSEQWETGNGRGPLLGKRGRTGQQEAKDERREARDDGVENIFERPLGASLRPDIVILRALPTETPGRKELASEERHRGEVQAGWAGKRTRAAPTSTTAAA